MKLYSVCHFREIFNVNLSKTHYDTDSTDMDKMILKPALPVSLENQI